MGNIFETPPGLEWVMTAIFVTIEMASSSRMVALSFARLDCGFLPKEFHDKKYYICAI